MIKLAKMNHDRCHLNLLRIAILTLASINYTTVCARVIIQGKIIGYDGKAVVYFRPTIEGIYTPYWKTIKPSGNGTFKIEFENEGYGNTTISYKNLRYRFFHDSNSQIRFEFKEVQDGKKKRATGNNALLLADSIKQLSTVLIAGDNEAINKFYNKNLRSSYSTTQRVDGSYYSDLIYNAATPSSALVLLDSLKQAEISQISRLPVRIAPEDPGSVKREAEITEFLTNEVDAFYNAVFLNAMFLKRKEHVIKTMTDSASKPNIYSRDWELLIERLGEQAMSSLKAYPNSPDYIDFMESMAYTMANYRQYYFPQNPTTSLDEEVINRLFNYDTTLFRDKRSRFAYELSGMQRFLNDQLYYSPVLLHAVYDLQAKYPESAHLEFYKANVEKLRSGLAVSKRDFDDAKVIRSSYDSFDDLLKCFAGNYLLIDIWATWCHPCIEEFKHKSMLQPFIESDKIQVLYLSIDKPEWEDRWRQSIKINELHGSHFRADKVFIEDMWNVIGDFKGAIPRYVLVDKEGKIFKRTAARPSEGNALVEQIELLIN